MTPPLSFSLHQTLSADQIDEVSAFVAAAPSGSYLQMPDWPARCQTPAHHTYVHLLARDAEGQLLGYGLTRLTRLLAGYKLATLRRGPVTLTPADLVDVSRGFAAELRKVGCCSMALNPRWQSDGPVADACLQLRKLGATELEQHSQPLHQATLLVDLSGDEADISTRLKQRARRQIRKAEKMGLTLRHVDTLEDAQRFGPLIETFHEERGLGLDGIPAVDELFAITRDRGVFLIGEVEGRIVCGHVAIPDGDRAFWLVMASDDTVRNIPKNYPLVHEAMRTAQAQGFRWYDMAGTPPLSAQAETETSEGAGNRDNFKIAFNPEYQPLVPMHVLPLRQPAHQILFGLRQWARARRAGKQAANL